MKTTKLKSLFFLNYHCWNVRLHFLCHWFQ